MYRLVVKNFGVLKDIDIVLNKTNLFIGNNGSGKSVLAKLITIITNTTLSEDKIYKKFKDFDIDFIKEDTFIEFKENNNSMIKIENKKLTFFEDKIKLENLLNELNSPNIQNKINEIKLFAQFSNKKTRDEIKEFSKIITNLNSDVEKLKSQYIPAERNLISLLNQSLSNLIVNEIPLPKSLMIFASNFEKAKNEIKELALLDMKYISSNGQDKIYYDDDNYLPLENSSSGMQTALPMYLTIKYFNSKHNNIIIEEPEQNLYPKAQIDTIKFIVENSDNNLYLMTHSPYVLSILNILIFAFKASNTNNILKQKIEAIVPPSQQINPKKFSAYLIKDGKSINIKGNKTGMIKENVIDDISDDIDDQFDELMELYREFKDAK